MSSLEDKVVLITEADSVSGQAAAVHFARERARLALAGADSAKLETVKKSCAAEGAKVHVVSGSLDKEADLKKIIEQAASHYGQLDVLVPVMGHVYHGTVETVDLAKLTAVLQRNVTNIVQLCQLAVPHLAKTKGNITIISSLGGIKSFPKLMPHCVAAAGLDMFVKCTAVDLGAKGIRVNSVCQGLIKDESNSGCSDSDFSKYIEFRPHRENMEIPLGGSTSVEYVANMAVFLASKDASFMTGTSLPVDGGLINVFPR